MPKKNKITEHERREWLEKSEAGNPLETIIAASNRSARSVRNGIRQALQDRDMRGLRAGLLKDAYKEHFTDLIGVARQIRDAAKIRPSAGLLQGRRTKMLLDALRSHIPTWGIWKAWDAKEKQVALLDAAEKKMKAFIQPKVSDLAREYPEVDTGLCLQSLMEAITTEAVHPGSLKWGYTEARAEKGLEVYWGPHRQSDEVKDEAHAKDIEKRHAGLWKSLMKALSQPMREYRLALQGWDMARDLIEQDLEVLELRKMIPGTCDLCPGVESRPRRRARRARRKRL